MRGEKILYPTGVWPLACISQKGWLLKLEHLNMKRMYMLHPQCQPLAVVPVIKLLSKTVHAESKHLTGINIMISLV